MPEGQRKMFPGWRPGQPAAEPARAASEEGTDRVQRGREEFVSPCLVYIASLESGVEFTADTLARWVRRQGLVAGHPNVFGSIFRSARASGLIESVGFTESKQPSRKAGAIRIWRRR